MHAPRLTALAAHARRRVGRRRAGVLAAVLVVAALVVPQMALADSPGGTQTVVNGSLAKQTVLLDTDGHRVDAHDGHIYFFGDRYYWYGTSYQCGFAYSVKSSNFCGMKVYESTDADHWKYDGFALNPTGDQTWWNAECGGGAGGCYRPKVAYNARNNDYVMWVNEVRGKDGSGYLVLSSPRPTGPFTLVHHVFPTYDRCPRGLYGKHAVYGDEDLFVDNNGVAYLIYGGINKPGNGCPATKLRQHNIAIEQLNNSYTAVTGRYTVYNDSASSIESPSFFRRGNTYYLLYSDPACPYCNTAGTGYATASRALGPYRFRGVLTRSQLGGQPTGVTPIATKSGTQYFYYLDRWNQVGPSTAITNQYKANYFFAPLAFTADGRVRSIPRIPHWQTQATSTSTSTQINALPVPATSAYQPLGSARRLFDSRTRIGRLHPSHGAYTFALPAEFRKSRAVALTITATAPTGGGYVRVWGAGAAPPTSALNYSKARPTVANMAVVAPTAGGTIHVTANTHSADVVVDLRGTYPARTSYAPARPARRLLDTRKSVALRAHGFRRLRLFQHGVAKRTRYVSANITTLAGERGSLQIYDPARSARPPRGSDLPFNHGIQANFTELPVPKNGIIEFVNDSAHPVNILVDEEGSDRGHAMHMLAEPYRLASTSDGIGPYTAPLEPDLDYPFSTAGSGVPANAAAVVLRLTTARATGNGYLSAYANQSGYSGTSDLNLTSGMSATNTTVVPLRNGRFDVFGATSAPYPLAVTVVGFVE